MVTAERVGNDIYMRFPSRSRATSSLRGLGAYVSDARGRGGGCSSSDGTSRHAHFRRGNAVTIIWIGPGQAEPATAEKPSATKPPDNKTPKQARGTERGRKLVRPRRPRQRCGEAACAAETAAAPPSPKADPLAPKADEKP